MGNSPLVGHAMNGVGLTDALGFETSASALINAHCIEPWSAKGLVKDMLLKQRELAKRSPLYQVPIDLGLAYIWQHPSLRWYQTHVTKEAFVAACLDLLFRMSIPFTPADRDDLFEVFDSMDFDRSGFLSVGELAGGLSVFLKGDTEKCVKAVFGALDTDKSDTLSRRELQEYLRPYVQAMSPAEAAAIRPVLLKKATDVIYSEMDSDKSNDVSEVEMLNWTKRGNSIIDRLAEIIDTEVYKLWLDQHQKRNLREKLNGPQTWQDSFAHRGRADSMEGFAPKARREDPKAEEALVAPPTLPEEIESEWMHNEYTAPSPMKAKSSAEQQQIPLAAVPTPLRQGPRPPGQEQQQADLVVHQRFQVALQQVQQQQQARLAKERAQQQQQAQLVAQQAQLVAQQAQQHFAQQAQQEFAQLAAQQARQLQQAQKQQQAELAARCSSRSSFVRLPTGEFN